MKAYFVDQNYFYRSFRRSLFGDDIKTISTPIVNPFLSGNALQILKCHGQHIEKSENKVTETNYIPGKDIDESESKEPDVNENSPSQDSPPQKEASTDDKEGSDTTERGKSSTNQR